MLTQHRRTTRRASVPAARRATAAPQRVPPRRLPAAQPVHDGQHVLRLRVHRLRDARRVRNGRAVHRLRDRARHARRPHRAADRHRPANSASSSTRWPTSFRSASRRRSCRSRGGCRRSAASAGRRDSCSSRRRRCAWRASTSRAAAAATSATSSACRARRRRRSRRRRSSRIRAGCYDYRAALPALAMVLVPALLMVSTIRFRSFKTIDLQMPAGRTRVLICHCRRHHADRDASRGSCWSRWPTRTWRRRSSAWRSRASGIAATGIDYLAS